MSYELREGSFGGISAITAESKQRRERKTNVSCPLRKTSD